MDLLTDLLQNAGIRRRMLDLRPLDAGTALQFPCDRSIGLHVVMHGRIHLHAPGLPEPLALDAGDIAVMARGCHHVLSLRASLQDSRVVPIGAARTGPDASREPVAAPDRSATDAPSGAVISGAYQLWNTPVHPFFGEMPAWFVLRADSLPRLGPIALAVGLIAEETGRRQMGADTVLHGLLDVLLTYLLREMVSRQGGAGAGWSHAVADPQIHRAVVLMHDDCARPWTLEDLAGRAGLSRTGLAERFREAMGDTPLSYLRTVRMQKAMHILSETDKPLEQVAREVGYQDAFGFSKAFKRAVGVAPRDFRRQDAQDRALPWRFEAA